MRRMLVVLLVASSIATGSVGCGWWRRRPYGDNTAASDRSATGPVLAPGDYPQLVPPGESMELQQTASELHPRSTVETRDEWQATRAATSHATSDPATAEREQKPSAAAPPLRQMSRMTLDHAADYSWVQGKLEYSALGGGVWKVRYAPLSADDSYGGSVILETIPDPKQFHPGDIVYVEGRVLQTDDAYAYRNPRYHVTILELVQAAH